MQGGGGRCLLPPGPGLLGLLLEWRASMCVSLVNWNIRVPRSGLLVTCPPPPLLLNKAHCFSPLLGSNLLRTSLNYSVLMILMAGGKFFYHYLLYFFF